MPRILINKTLSYYFEIEKFQAHMTDIDFYLDIFSNIFN